MVTIVTGKINSGKSSTILKHYQDNQLGDGFISVKRMHYDQVHGYDLMKLSDNSTRTFVVREEYLNENQEVVCHIGPYLFLKDTLDYVEKEIKQMVKNNISPIYLDEVGQLELYDQCFDNIFKFITSNNIDAVITVREDLVEKVTNKYNLINPKIITL